MIKTTLSTLKYSFSYHFVWFVLSFYHYLVEKISEEDIGKYYLKWSTPFENLANWAMDEWRFVLESNKVSQEDILSLSSFSLGLDDSLAHYFEYLLKNQAAFLYTRNQVLSVPVWSYYHYCYFVKQVIKEFDQIMREMGTSSVYYQRYQESFKLFQDMGAAMEQERPFLDNPENVDENTMHSIWAEIDKFSVGLGGEWRKAVLEAAVNQRLPDFINDSIGD
jgi:hypothetical protein